MIVSDLELNLHKYFRNLSGAIRELLRNGLSCTRVIQNHCSNCFRRVDSCCFWSLMYEPPHFMIQRPPPQDLSWTVQNELDLVCFYRVPGHRSKSSFLVPNLLLQTLSSMRNSTLRITPQLALCFKWKAPGLCMGDVSWARATHIFSKLDMRYNRFAALSI